MAATIKDIAKRLQISTSTVSYALNGGPRMVPDLVKEQVFRVAAELDYRPNSIAKSLVTRKSFTLGIVPTDRIEDLARMAYFQGCFNGIVNAAEELSYDVMVFTRFDRRQEGALINTLLDGRVDGVIFLAPKSDCAVVEAIRRRGIPRAVISADLGDDTPSFNCDNEIGIQMAVDHLVSLGHRRIGHIAGKPTMIDGIERRSAFERSMLAHGLRVDPDWILEGDFAPRLAEIATYKWHALPERPTAIVCANDDTALGVFTAAKHLGMKLPDDLSLVGYDNASYGPLTTPTLTTISQPLDLMGAAAVRAILAMGDGKMPASLQFKPELVVRASTSSPQEDPKS